MNINYSINAAFSELIENCDNYTFSKRHFNQKILNLEFPNRGPLTILYRKDSDQARDLKEIDALDIETNSGFNDLGLYTKYIAKEMNIDEDIIRGFGDSLFKEKQPIIHIFPTQSSIPSLRAVYAIGRSLTRMVRSRSLCRAA
jgi:hypothetical protein